MAKVKNWSEADLVLKELSELQAQKDKAVNEMNQMIAETKLEYSLDIEPVQDKIESLIEQLQEFADNNKDSYDGKSKKLIFGKVGHRESTSYKVPSKEQELILGRLRDKGMEDCIKIKTTRSVVKSALRNYSDEQVREIGIKKIIKDNFYYELNQQSLA